MKRKKLTIKYLEKIGACSEAVQWMESHKERDIKVLYQNVVKTQDTEHLEWGNWLLTRLLNYENRVKYALYAAKQVLINFEQEYPQDKGPRQAIAAALKCLKNPSSANESAARSAASAAYSAARSATRSVEFAAESAAWAAARSAAFAAESAAESAEFAAESAAGSAVWSAESAARSAARSARSAARKQMQVKILKYGLKLYFKTKE